MLGAKVRAAHSAGVYVTPRHTYDVSLRCAVHWIWAPARDAGVGLRRDKQQGVSNKRGRRTIDESARSGTQRGAE